MVQKKQSIQLVNSIRSLIIQKNLLQPNQTLVLAISGGQDSIFLLIVFFILKKQWNIELKVLYCNHLWQKESFYIYFHISKILFCFNFQFYYFITLKVLPSEEKSRYWRSKIFYRLLHFTKSSNILTGHTMTDQIETFLFNMIRGSSFKGISSLRLKKRFNPLDNNNFSSCNSNFISFKLLKKSIFQKKKKKKQNLILLERKRLIRCNKVNKGISFFPKKKFFILNKNSIQPLILRPLITKTRYQIKTICNVWKLPVFPDQTNQQTKYSRNRLRKQILPTFRFFFNPKVDFILSRYNQILTEEEQYNETLINKLILVVINEDQNAYYINLSLFCSLSLSFQRRICFFFFKEKLLLKFKFSTIDNFVNSINLYYLQLKKQNKKQKFHYLFFPEIGTIYFSETLFIVFK